MNQRHYFALGILLAVAVVLLVTLSGAQAPDPDLPGLPGTGWWSGLSVQNAGGRPASVNLGAIAAVTPSPTGTRSPTPTGTPPTAVSYMGYQWANDPVLPCYAANLLPSDFFGVSGDFVGSAFVNGTEPLKSVVSLSNRLVGDGQYGVVGGQAVAVYDSPDFASADTELYFPLAKKASGPTNPERRKSSMFFVQNAGKDLTHVTATFWCDNQPTPAATAQTGDLRPGAMAVIDMPAGIGDGAVCTVKLAADPLRLQPIAGVVAEYFTVERINGGPATLLQAARGFTPGEYGYGVYVPLYKNKFPNVTNQGRSTGVAVANVGDTDTSVLGKVTYVTGCSGSIETSDSVTIPAHGYHVFLKPTTREWTGDMPVGCMAAARFWVPVDEMSPPYPPKIVAVASESFLDPIAAPGVQSAMMSGAIPAQQASKIVFLPMFKERYNNRTSGVAVQNTSSENATCSMEFFNASGVYTTTSATIVAGQSGIYTQISLTPMWTSTPMPPSGGLFSGRVTCSQDVAAVVSEGTFYVTPGTTPPAGAYCFGPTPACPDRTMYTGFNATYTYTPSPTPTATNTPTSTATATPTPTPTATKSE